MNFGEPRQMFFVKDWMMKKESDSISFSSALGVASTLNSIFRKYKSFNVELLGH